MFKKAILAISTGIILGLSGCGGGDSNGNSSSTTAINSLNGSWLSQCKSGQRATTTYNNNSIQVIIKTYATADCSGTTVSSEKFSGEVDYVGTFATPTCMADMINVTFNNRNTFYSLACIYTEKLFEGLAVTPRDGSSSSKRPQEMNLSAPFTRI